MQNDDDVCCCVKFYALERPLYAYLFFLNWAFAHLILVSRLGFSQIGQGGPAWIHGFMPMFWLFIEVLTALHTKSQAVWLAERLNGQSQNDRVSKQWFKVN